MPDDCRLRCEIDLEVSVLHVPCMEYVRGSGGGPKKQLSQGYFKFIVQVERSQSRKIITLLSQARTSELFRTMA